MSAWGREGIAHRNFYKEISAKSIDVFVVNSIYDGWHYCRSV